LSFIERISNGKEKQMKLSNQGAGTLMLCLQKSLFEQSDIMPMLKELNFVVQGEEIVCTNPPTFDLSVFNEEDTEAKD
tara:strand:- start:56 stop:289 length:234 start_codon:yes stop_codon:yes gene_type:complete